MIRRLIASIRRWNADSMDRHRLEGEAISRGSQIDHARTDLTATERADLAAYDDYINRVM